MDSQDDSSIPSNCRGSMPSSNDSNHLSASAQPSDDARHLIQGQDAGSASNHTGKTFAPAPLTNLSAFSIDPMNPTRILNPIRATVSPQRVAPVASPRPGDQLKGSEENFFVGKGIKPKADTRGSGKSNTIGKSKAQKLFLDDTIYLPKKEDDNALDDPSGGIPTTPTIEENSWKHWEELLPAGDEARARAAAKSKKLFTMPAIKEEFRKIQAGATLDDRDIVARRKIDVPARFVNWDTHNFSKESGAGSAEYSTIAEMFEFWRSNFGMRRMCLTHDPKGPRLNFDQLKSFSTAQVHDHSFPEAGYLTGDVLENATAAFLGPSAYIVPTSVIKLYLDAAPEVDGSTAPDIKLDRDFIIMYINSGLHWHAVVIDVHQKLWYIRDSSHVRERRQKTVGDIVPLLLHWWGDVEFKLAPGSGPQQEDGYNCGVFAHDNAVQLVRADEVSSHSGNLRRFKLLQAILYRARTYISVGWQADPAARVFSPTEVADMPTPRDFDFTKDTVEDLLSNNARSNQSGQTNDTPKKSWADQLEDNINDDELSDLEYDLSIADESRDHSQVGGVELPDDDQMDSREDPATNRLAASFATSSGNPCLEPPQPWRLLPAKNNVRLAWAEKQVFERIPDYIKLHNVQTKTGSDWYSAADIASAYGQLPPSQVSRPQPQLLLFQGQTYVITRLLKKVLSGVFTVLNMASEKRPGGMLFMNSRQQEQSLCVQGQLYERLSQLRGGKYPLKPGELIFTEDVFVCFSNGHHALPISEAFYTHVISMPAPICPRGTTAKGYATSGNGIQMRKDIKTLMDAADAVRTNVLVLSGWGCGVYHHPPAEVARMFRAELSTRDWSRSSITHVVFAIFDEKPKKPVWNPFKDVLHDALPGFMPTRIDFGATNPVNLWLDMCP